MLIKIGIIAVVFVGALLVLSSQINEYLPNTTTSGLDSFKQDVDSITANSLQSTEQTVNKSSNYIREQMSDAGGVALDAADQTLDYAESQLHSAADKVGEGLSGLEDTSSNLVGERVTEIFESVPGT